MGLPLEELDQFLAWEQDWVHGDTLAKQQEAMRAILTYLEDCVADPRARPRDDLLTPVATSEIHARPLDSGGNLRIGMCLCGAGLATHLATGGVRRCWAVSTRPGSSPLRRS